MRAQFVLADNSTKLGHERVSREPAHQSTEVSGGKHTAAGELHTYAEAAERASIGKAMNLTGRTVMFKYFITVDMNVDDTIPSSSCEVLQGQCIHSPIQHITYAPWPAAL